MYRIRLESVRTENGREDCNEVRWGSGMRKTDQTHLKCGWPDGKLEVQQKLAGRMDSRRIWKTKFGKERFACLRTERSGRVDRRRVGP